MRTLIAGFVALSLLAAGSVQAFKRTSAGGPVKDFTIGIVGGETLRLSENLGRKATLVVFWAAWSPRSDEALSEFQELYAAHGPDDLRVIAVNVEHAEWDSGEVAKIEDFVRKKQLAFPVALDQDLAVFDAYGVVAVPSTVLTDAEGTIVELMEGYAYTTRHDFRGRILEQLGVRDPAEADPTVAVKYQPKGNAARYYQMGEMFLAKKMTRRAVKAFAKSVKEDPEYSEAHLRWAEALEAEGNQQKAAEVRSRAAALGGTTTPGEEGSAAHVMAAPAGGGEETPGDTSGKISGK